MTNLTPTLIIPITHQDLETISNHLVHICVSRKRNQIIFFVDQRRKKGKEDREGRKIYQMM